MNISPLSKKISNLVTWAANNLVVHLFLLGAVALSCLPQHAYRLFNGLDGIRKLILAKHEWLWMHHGFFQGMNLFQGMGNLFYGFNLNLIPVFFLQQLLIGHVGFFASYILFSLQAFLTAYIWSRLFGFTKQIALAAGWVFVLSTLPFLPTVYLGAEFQTVPQFIDLLFFSTLLLCLFRQVGRKGLLISLLCLSSLIFIVYYLSVVYLYFVVMTVPVLAISAIYFCCIVESRKEFIFKLFTICIVLGVMFALRIPQFLYGVTFYTAFAFFMHEMPDVHTQWSDFSLLFHYAQGVIYPLWVILGMVGAIFAWASRNVHLKKFALLHMILTVSILCIGLLTMYSFDQFGWRGPQGSYYEMLLWPSYVVFTVYAVARIVKISSLWLHKGIKQLDFVGLVGVRKNKPNIHVSFKGFSFIFSYRHYFIFLIPLAAILFNHPEHTGISWMPGKPFPQTEAYPPKITPIVRVLRDSIALQPRSHFKGYAAIFTPAVEAGKRISWHNQVLFDSAVTAELGNDHRFDGLWYYDIPTLNEYSHLITPPLYLLGTRLLGRRIDEEDRTSILYTVPNINLLRMLGVRFIITNTAKKYFSTVKEAQYASLKQQQFIDKKHGSLYLYALSDPNLGSYSPVHFIVAKTAKAMLALMKNNTLNYKQVVIVSKALPAHLVPATQVSMQVGKFGVHVKAHSAGISTLLLPIQYSHCLKSVFNKTPSYFSIHRANLVETLLVFSGKLEANLNFTIGPLHHSNCRIADLKDMQHLKMKQAAYSSYF